MISKSDFLAFSALHPFVNEFTKDHISHNSPCCSILGMLISLLSWECTVQGTSLLLRQPRDTAVEVSRDRGHSLSDFLTLFPSPPFLFSPLFSSTQHCELLSPQPLLDPSLPQDCVTLSLAALQTQICRNASHPFTLRHC